MIADRFSHSVLKSKEEKDARAEACLCSRYMVEEWNFINSQEALQQEGLIGQVASTLGKSTEGEGP